MRTMHGSQAQVDRYPVQMSGGVRFGVGLGAKKAGHGMGDGSTISPRGGPTYLVQNLATGVPFMGGLERGPVKPAVEFTVGFPTFPIDGKEARAALSYCPTLQSEWSERRTFRVSRLNLNIPVAADPDTCLKSPDSSSSLVRLRPQISIGQSPARMRSIHPCLNPNVFRAYAEKFDRSQSQRFSVTSAGKMVQFLRDSRPISPDRVPDRRP